MRGTTNIQVSNEYRNHDVHGRINKCKRQCHSRLVVCSFAAASTPLRTDPIEFDPVDWILMAFGPSHPPNLVVARLRHLGTILFTHV